jgi:hypothetical protein
LGQKQTFGLFIAMSALPPKADIVHGGGNVRFVPEADIGQRQSIPSSPIAIALPQSLSGHFSGKHPRHRLTAKLEFDAGQTPPSDNHALLGVHCEG